MEKAKKETKEAKELREIKEKFAQYEKNVSIVISHLPLGTLKTLREELFPHIDEPTSGKKKQLRLDLSEEIKNATFSEKALPVRRNLKGFEPETLSVEIWSTRKTKDAMKKKLVEKIEALVEERKFSQFTVGKASGPDARTATYNRWAERYSKHDYTGMIVIYQDMDTDQKLHKNREDRAFDIETYLHEKFSHCTEWDTRWSDAQGNKSKTETARFFVYLAFKE